MDPSMGRRTSSRASARSDKPSAVSAALERLKSRRIEVKLEKPIYDTMPEEDYAALVERRRAEVQDFVVDDDGLGYADMGEEEDWQKAAYQSSEEEEDDEEEKAKKKVKKEKKKADGGMSAKKAAEFSAAGALSKKISSMYTSAPVFKGGSFGKGVSDDVGSFVEQLIAENVPDESDREKWRKTRIGVNTQQTSSRVANHFVNGGQSFIKEENNAQRFGSKASAHLQNVGAYVKPEPVDSLATESKKVFSEAGDSDNPEKSKPEKMDNDMVSFHALSDRDGALDKIGELSDNSVKENLTTVEEKKGVNLQKKTSEEAVPTLNAKINVKYDPALAATAGWKSVWQGDNGSASVRNEACEEKPECNENPDLLLDSDGSLQFYMLDAYEEIYGENRGNLYLFGKVKNRNGYASCCVIVKNMQRCVYAVPSTSIFPQSATIDLERQANSSETSSRLLRTKLQEMALPLKTELSTLLLDIDATTFSMTPVKRNYAFERSDIWKGEQYVMKVTYPFKDPPIPFDVKGNNFSTLLGTHSSALELFLVKRRIKGPSWLSISKQKTASQRVSWCKYEVVVDSPKDVKVSTSKFALEIPPVTVASLSLKTIRNEKKNVNEIVSVSIVFCHMTKIDVPMLTSEWNKAGSLSHFTIVRKLEGGIFPLGFTKEVSDRNAKACSVILGTETNERALLNRLMIEIHKSDCDFLVGHNISGFDLDVILHRAQALNVMWSKIGRLKRSVMPKLMKSSSIFGSGASPGALSCIAGRILCDTYLSSRELLRETSYSLTHLAKSQLGKDRRDVSPLDVPLMFQTSSSLLELVEHGETDAWLSLGLMFHLSVLPLTRQLTTIGGNLWAKTLQGARAQRVEYYLLHAFHELKYLLPDKTFNSMKESSSKRGLTQPSEAGAASDQLNASEVENEDLFHENEKRKKGPAYAGGLVLEPKKGLYDKYILLLDFNSLYPSIIQEYNICFTTVERPPDGSIPGLPTSEITGVLPKLLHSLVDRRRKVKQWMKNTSDRHKLQQLDIQQQALKLTANSIYGCLGFLNSRFYAKPLAELITLQGREILQSTVDLVQNHLNLEVIYGDTDSIMIYTGLDNIDEAKEISKRVIKEVNKKYSRLEIDLDGIYKRMLLLKKKKYAAVKVQLNNDGLPYEIIERKGLDMVRRDWSLISKELGDFCLSQILSGGSCEDVLESIHGRLMQVQEKMRNGEIELEKYIIMKTLTKPPEAYPDAKNQPHVQVALRLKQAGHSSGCSAGDTMPYIICCQQGDVPRTSTGIAQRARHPDELRQNTGWIIDIEYYLSQQIHPVVSRLCACIQGTSSARLADCLGLESSKFQHKANDLVDKDSQGSTSNFENYEERFRGCEPLWLACCCCSSTFECPTVSSFLEALLCQKQDAQGETETTKNFWYRLHCSNCPLEDNASRITPGMIANQVQRQAEKFILKYYNGLMVCDDEMCQHTTRCPNLRVMGDSERGTICPNYPRCNGHLVRQFTEADLYKQLSYFCHVLDAVYCVEKMDIEKRTRLEKQLSSIRNEAGLAAKLIRKIRDRCAFGWVKIADITV